MSLTWHAGGVRGRRRGRRRAGRKGRGKKGLRSAAKRSLGGAWKALEGAEGEVSDKREIVGGRGSSLRGRQIQLRERECVCGRVVLWTGMCVGD